MLPIPLANQSKPAVSLKPTSHNSPTKLKLLAFSKDRPLPISREREIIGCGDQCLVFENGHKEVYIVTRYLIAKRFELLNSIFGRYNGELHFHIPDFVTANFPLTQLHSPKMTAQNKSFFKKQYDIYAPLLNDNCIYKMPRYDGTLNDYLIRERLSESAINLLQNTIQTALKELHLRNITHNDLSRKNIYYTGDYPNVKFFLGDFGSISQNEKKDHEKLAAKDLAKLSDIVKTMRSKLDAKYNSYTPYKRSMPLTEKHCPSTTKRQTRSASKTG